MSDRIIEQAAFDNGIQLAALLAKMNNKAVRMGQDIHVHLEGASVLRIVERTHNAGTDTESVSYVLALA